MQTIPEFFRGKVVLIAGATGFLGQALVAKILTALPDVKQLYLLIRSQTEANGERRSATDRLENEVFTSSAFAKLRHIHGEQFGDWVREKVYAVEGDMAYERLGLSDADYEMLQREVQIFINSGGLVKFDPPIDASLQSNVLGSKYAVELAKGCNDVVFLHVSTAYVRGARPGRVPEELHPPYEAYAERYQAEKGEPIPETLDAEIEDIQQLGEQIRDEANQPEMLDRFRSEILQNSNIAAGEKLNRQINIAQEKWVEQRLIDEGLKRAHARGWNDTYTYMKALGEQMITKTRGDLPTAIIRQSIMESSLEDPEPGWLGGALRMADPLIVGFGKGRLPDFPGDPNSILDIIPADFVINAILAATVQTYYQRGIEVYHVASGARNPLTFGDIVNITYDYFTRQPMLDNGKPIPVPVWKFPDKQKFQKDLRQKLRLLDIVSYWLGCIPLRWAKRKDRRIAVKKNAIKTLLHYVQIYGPYVRLSFEFEIGKTEALYHSLSSSDQQLFNFDISRLNWRHYFQEVHIPGIKRHFLKLGQESGSQRISEPTSEPIDEPPADASAEEESSTHNESEAQPIDESSDLSQSERDSKPLESQTMIDLVARQAESIPDKIALQMKRNKEWVRYSYRQLYEASRQAAFTLWEHGHRKGDRVILFAENQPEWGIAYLAAVQIGVIVVPIDPQTAVEEIFALADYTEAKAILTSETCIARLHNAQVESSTESTSLECLDINRFCQPFECEQSETDVPTKSELPTVPDNFPDVDIHPDTVASIIFTMGTTVNPRGAMLSHRGFIANVVAVSQALPPEDADRFLSVLPLYHALGFSCNFLMSIYAGTTITYTNSLRPTTILAMMRETETTVLIGVPRLFQLLYDTIKRYVVQSPEAMEAPLDPEVVEQILAALGGHIRVLVSGGAALPDEIYDRFKELGLTIYQGYGMTEASPVLSVNPQHKSKRGSVGPAVQGVQLQLLNPDENGIGEIVAGSPSLMQGYYQNQAVTKKVIQDGLLYTGDLGYFDEEGYLYLTGRGKEVIVSGAGKNIYPVELETLYRHSPLISEICVVGMSTDNLFEAAHAVIVPACDANQDRDSVEKAIHQHIQKRAQDLPTYQHLQTVHFWDTALPKASDTVIDRERVKAVLREQLSQQTQVAPQPDLAKDTLDAGENKDTLKSVEAVIISELSRLANLPADQIRLDSNLGTELGLDSMARVELLLLLESKLQRSVPDELIAKIQTVGDVTETVKTMQSESTPPPVDEETSAYIEQSESSHLSTALAGLFRFGVGAIYRYYFSIKCNGLENLPCEQSYIIAANHSSHLDTLAIMTVLGTESKRLRVLAAKDYWFSTRFKSWFSGELLKFVPFDRHANFLQGLRISQAVLKQNECLLIYPEGTRSVTGELQPFKSGLGLLAYESKSPIVPAYIEGTYHALPKGKSLPRKSRIRVTFGEPIGPLDGREIAGTDAAPGLEQETYKKLADAVKSKIEALSRSATQNDDPR